MASILETQHSAASDPAPVDPLALGGIDHLEWWVGNARATAAFFAACFGFDIVAYCGPETGVRDRVSYLLQQGEIRHVVTGGLHPDSPVARHVRRHGDGVHDVALLVDDAAAVYETALHRGATGVMAPEPATDDHGSVVRATISAYGDTNHSFVQRNGYRGVFAPGFEPADDLHRPPGPPVDLTRIDHVVANVAEGTLEGWVDFYRNIMGFERLVHFDDSQISTEYTALMSSVVWDGSKVVLPINEPAEGLRKSQIDEYLEFYGGPGVQHIAMATDDIVASVRALRERGVRFLAVPSSYYDEARQRMEGIELPWRELSQLGILVDRDADGYLLQIFTETVTDRPTVFFEIIQREGATGFGVGNFKALFEAIEREQARRGNL